jgi:hypothetical protein
VHEVQGEPRCRADRERDVGEHHQARLVLGPLDGDRGERDAVEAHIASHRAARVDPAAARDVALVGQPAVQRAGQPAQRLLQLHPLVLADPVHLGHGPFVRLHDALLQLQQRLQVLLDRLGETGEDAGEAAAQGRGVGLVALLGHLVLDVVEPAQQGLLLGDRQVGVDLRALRFRDLAWDAGAVQAIGLDLHAADVTVGAAPVVLREDDLLGHRGQVDLVGLLVQVVLLSELLGVEVVADVDGLAVRVALLRGLARLLGQRELVEAVVGAGEVLVAVPVAVPGIGRADLHQREELVEDLVEDLLVAPVLDQRDAQGRPQLLAVAQHPGLRGARHRVQRLRNRDAHLAQPQQPDEPVQGVLHHPPPDRSAGVEITAPAAGRGSCASRGRP